MRVWHYLILALSSKQDTTIPSCRTCKYYVPSTLFNYDMEFSKCSKFGKEKSNFHYTDHSRKYEDLCGPKAVHYEKNNSKN
jgi:hypothetical protein